MAKFRFEAEIQRYASKGDKTNWTYIRLSAELANRLNPGNRKGFRVSGWLDELRIEKVSLIPEGEGNFILPINATMRRQIRKTVGAKVLVTMMADLEPPPLDQELIQCLRDEPEAWNYFSSLTPSHQRYFSTWVSAARTTATRDKRIAHSVEAMIRNWDYGQMIRSLKKVE
jgi:hypothetical protein